MTCREFTDFLTAYFDHALPAGQQARFEQHLERCRHCAISLANYRQTIRMGRAAFADPEGDIPQHVSEKLVQAIVAARRVQNEQ